MANSDKNILITPNRNVSGKPEISLTGFGASTGKISVPDYDNLTVSFEYGNKSVFSVNETSSGEILTVSDGTGLPLINVNSNGNVELSPQTGITTVLADGLQLPGYATTCLPVGETGLMVFDKTVNRPKVYDGFKWITVGTARDGSSPLNAAVTAKQILKDYPGTPSGFYWIQTPGNSTPTLTYCDMTTAGGGWMLVASWSDCATWGFFSYSSKEVFGTTPLNTISSNFGNCWITDFRVHVAANVTTTGSSAIADWYYNWTGGTTWKQVWAPDDYTKFYLSGGSNPAVQRCCLRPFNRSVNIKFGYENLSHKFHNLSDYGYQASRDATTSTGTLGSNASTTASAAGFCKYWDCFTKPGYEYGVYNLSYTGSFVDQTSPTVDGSLGLPIRGAGTDTDGQDVDGNLSVKIGRDDDVVWRAAATSAATDPGNTGAGSGPMWWWIR